VVCLQEVTLEQWYYLEGALSDTFVCVRGEVVWREEGDGWLRDGGERRKQGETSGAGMHNPIFARRSRLVQWEEPTTKWLVHSAGAEVEETSTGGAMDFASATNGTCSASKVSSLQTQCKY
jgi:hypothetical protein